MRALPRALARIALLLPLACAGPAANHTTMKLPDWSGPPVHCRHLGDGGLQVELTAPTAGHRLTLVEVVAEGACTNVRLSYELPRADFTAQVITPLTVDIAKAELGNARAVCVWIASGDDADHLAITTARPL